MKTIKEEIDFLKEKNNIVTNKNLSVEFNMLYSFFKENNYNINTINKNISSLSLSEKIIFLSNLKHDNLEYGCKRNYKNNYLEKRLNTYKNFLKEK